MAKAEREIDGGEAPAKGFYFVTMPIAPLLKGFDTPIELRIGRIVKASPGIAKVLGDAVRPATEDEVSDVGIVDLN